MSAERHIAVYIRPLSMLNPTGVGLHQRRLPECLSEMPGTRVTLLAPTDDLVDGRLPIESPLDELPMIGLPGSARSLEISWMLFGRPRVDRFLPDGVDWVYSPFEAFLPTERRQASTIHCDNWFERDLPWYGRWRTFRARLRFRPLFRQILRKATVVFAVSEFLKGRLEELFGVDSDMISVVGNGVDDVFFKVERHENKRQKYFLVIGSLRERKGAEYILKIAEALRERQAPVAIRVASGSTSEPRYKAAAERLHNVELLAYQDQQALVEQLAGASGVLFPSRYETFGIPALEAMAARVPVIVSGWGALPEVVGDGALIVDPSDCDAVVDVMMDLLSDQEAYEGMIQKGVERARNNSWGRCAKRVLDAMSTCGNNHMEL